MCTTNQYVYTCSHPAAYRFRTGICCNPASRSCRIRDENFVLPYTCPRCAAKARTQNGKERIEQIRQKPDNNILVAKKTWYIPSRCFIDSGFQNLDPFGTGLETEGADQAGRRPAFSSISKLSSIREGTNANDEFMKKSQQPISCCLESRRMGAYRATRLEGLGDRVGGKIVDSLCRSWL